MDSAPTRRHFAHRAARQVARAGAAMLDFALPHRCAGCSAIVASSAGFCSTCWAELPFLAGPACTQCAMPFEFTVPPGTRCGACLAQPPSWSRAAALWRYDGPARAAVLALKYGDRTTIVRHLAPLLARRGAHLLTPDVLIIPVPLHRWRMAHRTFNQSALLATELARRTGAGVALRALERIRATTPQQGLDRDARRSNVRAAFAVPPGRRREISGRVVVLVDDVYTTGATLEACARVLLRSGAADVQVLTVTRVVADAAKAV